jgi:hypothetical protein
MHHRSEFIDDEYGDVSCHEKIHQMHFILHHASSQNRHSPTFDRVFSSSELVDSSDHVHDALQMAVDVVEPVLEGEVHGLDQARRARPVNLEGVHCTNEGYEQVDDMHWRLIEQTSMK